MNGIPFSSLPTASFNNDTDLLPAIRNIGSNHYENLMVPGHSLTPLSSSYSTSCSLADLSINALTSSYVSESAFAHTSSHTVTTLSASYAISTSYSDIAVLANTASNALYSALSNIANSSSVSTNAQSASYSTWAATAFQASSSVYAVTASFAMAVIDTGSGIVPSSSYSLFSVSSSNSVSSSYSLSSSYAKTVDSSALITGFAGYQVGYAYAQNTSYVAVAQSAGFAWGHVPTSTDGTQLLGLTYTPKYSGSILEICLSTECDINNSQSNPAAAIFTSMSPNAIAMRRFNSYHQYSPATPFVVIGIVQTVSTSPIIIQARAGNAGGGTSYFNNSVPSNPVGNGLPMYLTVKEMRQS